MKDRIYICHTYYHAYIAFLKELHLRRTVGEEKRGQATLMLSTMSNNFESFDERARKTGLWEEVLTFDEKKEDFFPELAEYRTDRGSLVRNLLQRIRFTKRFAQLEESYIPVNLKEYGSVYVFCDSDPIGYYLNQRHIRYHAMEDGLNCLAHFDAAHYDNRGHFGLKAFMSKRLNLIHIQNGYGKYCLDMEVNDISLIREPCPYYVEYPRARLTQELTGADKEIILSAFVRDEEGVQQGLSRDDGRKKTLVLTDPLCDLETRERLFRDIVEFYSGQGQVFIKPHPRDLLDYHAAFPDIPVIDATMPMEMLNFFRDLHFDTAVTVYTDLKGIDFADRKVRLGNTFMDRYEDPSAHAQNTTEHDDPLA